MEIIKNHMGTGRTLYKGVERATVKGKNVWFYERVNGEMEVEEVTYKTVADAKLYAQQWAETGRI